jgi:cytochrome c
MAKPITLSGLVLTAALTFAAVPAQVAANAAPTKSSAAKGKLLFMRCAACHNVKQGAPNKLGPNLAGIVGAKAGAVEGFRYSPAMKKANVTWDEGTLDKWLARPASVVPGTSMIFAGMPKPEERQAIIAYLKQPDL